MATIGQILKQAREQKGVSVAEAAAAIKGKQVFILAIEDDRFDALIAPVYARGFIKLYAEYLGLDAHALLRMFQAQMEERDGRVAKKQAEPPPPAPARSTPAAPPPLPAKLAGLIRLARRSCRLFFRRVLTASRQPAVRRVAWRWLAVLILLVGAAVAWRMVLARRAAYLPPARYGRIAEPAPPYLP